METNLVFDQLRDSDPLALSAVNQNHKIYYISKRVLDFWLALIILIFLLPLMVVVGILIKLDSPGPIFFKQNRVTVKKVYKNNIAYWQKVIFTCYKFRTMITDADPTLHKSYVKALIDNDCKSMAELQGEETTTRKLTRDPRITRIGKFLRKTSIDEIPQFINVIKGEMSLVGPRPAIPYEIEMYKPWYFRRLETKPGITGLWQVTARSSCIFDEIVKLDINYVDNQSFWLDLKILLKTPIAVIFCRGAL